MRAAEAFRSGVTAIGVLLVVGVVFGTWINIAIALSISRAAGRAAALGEAISKGELGVPVLAQGNDELAVMTRQLEAMRHTLLTMVSRVRDCAENINVASGEIDAGGRDADQHFPGSRYRVRPLNRPEDLGRARRRNLYADHLIKNA